MLTFPVSMESTTKSRKQWQNTDNTSPVVLNWGSGEPLNIAEPLTIQSNSTYMIRDDMPIFALIGWGLESKPRRIRMLILSLTICISSFAIQQLVSRCRETLSKAKARISKLVSVRERQKSRWFAVNIIICFLWSPCFKAFVLSKLPTVYHICITLWATRFKLDCTAYSDVTSLFSPRSLRYYNSTRQHKHLWQTTHAPAVKYWQPTSDRNGKFSQTWSWRRRRHKSESVHARGRGG